MERIVVLQEEEERPQYYHLKKSGNPAPDQQSCGQPGDYHQDLRHEIDEMGKTMTYLNGHEALIYKVYRKLANAVRRRFPKE